MNFIPKDYFCFSKEINPHLLDICLEENVYSLFDGDKPVLSPYSNRIETNKYRLLQFILFELSRSKLADNSSLNSYAIHSFFADFISKGSDPLCNAFDLLIVKDHFYDTSKNWFADSNNSIDIMELVEADQLSLNYLLGGIISINKNLRKLLNKIRLDDNEVENINVKKLKLLYKQLTDYQKAAVNVSYFTNNSGVVLPLLLVKNIISPSEYSMALYCLSLCEGNKSFESANQIMLKSYEDYYTEAQIIVEYLSYFGKLEDTNEELVTVINNGESYAVEFKSTLRMNLKIGKKESVIEHASLKTIAAFLNSGGGTLLIGVRDDGSIEGIESDQFQNSDKFLIHFWNLVKESFDIDLTSLVFCELAEIDDKTVCTVKCYRSNKPVFLSQKGFDEEFYIRVGPSSIRLGIAEAFKYINKHWGEPGGDINNKSAIKAPVFGGKDD